MARGKVIPDDRLREALAKGQTQQAIASVFGVSQPAIAKRIRQLEPRALAAVPENVTRAVASVWDTRAALQENYQRMISLLDGLSEEGDKIRGIGEIRQHLALSMSILETLYSVQEVQAFQEEVLTVLDECEPGTRERILVRLRERRALRAAFL